MKSHVERYGAAAGLTLVGVAVALLFQRVRGIPDAMIFAATVALTARFFGAGPSLFASALSIVAIDFTMLPPLGRLEFTHPEEIAYLAVFVGCRSSSAALRIPSASRNRLLNESRPAPRDFST